jgi:Plasma-membrane choline transporter
MSAPAETLSEPLLSQSSGSTTTTTSTSQKQQHVATAPPPYHQEDEGGGGGMGIAIEPLLVVVDDSNGPGPDEDLQRGQQQSPWEQYGHVQPKAFRDWPWAVLFLIQLIAVIVLAVFGMIHLFKHGAPINWWWPFSGDDDGPDPSPTQYDDDILKDDDGNHHGGAGGGGTSSSSADPFMNGLWFFLILTSSVIGLSAVMMNVLLGPLSGMMIQVSLVTSPLCFGFTTLVSLLTFNIPMLIFAGVMTILGIVYARSVWHRIPFATANINVAMAALKANHGLWILAYVMTVKAYLWTAIWASAFLEVFVYNPHWVYNCYTTSDSTSGEDTTIVCDWSTRGKFVVVGFFLSLFWTAQVLKNVFHTTIAGVVGTWWFAPDEATSTSALAAGARTVSTMEQGGDDQQVVFETTETGLGEHRTTNRCCCCCSFCGCSPAIFDSWVRSTFYSFGSICFGSLLVGILRLLQAIIRCGRQRRQQQQNMNGTSSPGSGDLCCCLLQCLVDHLEHLMEYL